jgi:hypothetical protein
MLTGSGWLDPRAEQRWRRGKNGKRGYLPKTVHKLGSSRG